MSSEKDNFIEIIFVARIHPRAKAAGLSARKVSKTTITLDFTVEELLKVLTEQTCLNLSNVPNITMCFPPGIIPEENFNNSDKVFLSPCNNISISFDKN
jgi:hypothetical protein